MYSLNDTALESNKYLKINFDGGDLSLLFTPFTVVMCEQLQTLYNLYKFVHYHCYFLVKRVYFKALNTRSIKL